MKIFHPILCYFPSQAGGPANTLYWLNSALNPNEFSSTIVATNFGVAAPINTKEYGKGHKVFFFNGKGRRYIKQSLQTLKTTDVVQFSSLFYPPTLPILLMAILSNKAIVMSPRGELYQAAVSQKAFKKKIWLAVIKQFQNKINFHATNNFELNIINKTFPKAKSTIVIPNYIEMSEKYNTDINNNLVFVGRINPIKNIHILISAIAEVNKLYPSAKLDIIGSARLEYEVAYMQTLKEQIKELALEKVVTFKGHLDGEAKHQAIAASKALILPSKSENFGNVVLEALAQGTPVIASKNTPWQLLEKHKAGAWIEGEVVPLAKRLQELLSLDKTAYTQMRDNAYELCKSKFDIKTNIHIWENYYKKITTYVQK